MPRGETAANRLYGKRLTAGDIVPRRGNPDWGKFVPFSPALPTEFEREVRKLRLAKEMYVDSVKLRALV